MKMFALFLVLLSAPALAQTAGEQPSLIITFDPASPTVPDNTARGAIIATVNVTWSDGSPFTGSLDFGPPFGDDGGKFALSGKQIIVNPKGPGLSGSGNRLNVTIVATQ